MIDSEAVELVGKGVRGGKRLAPRFAAGELSTNP
jgi:hypothetical protein